jgi:hypothetical protein
MTAFLCQLGPRDVRFFCRCLGTSGHEGHQGDPKPGSQFDNGDCKGQYERMTRSSLIQVASAGFWSCVHAAIRMVRVVRFEPTEQHLGKDSSLRN